MLLNSSGIDALVTIESRGHISFRKAARHLLQLSFYSNLPLPITSHVPTSAMASSQKRKVSADAEFGDSESKRRYIEQETAHPEPVEAEEAETAEHTTTEVPSVTGDATMERSAETQGTVPESSTSATPASSALQSLREKFKALQALKRTAVQSNTKEAQHEAHRLSQNPDVLTKLSRKHAIASHKLLKSDTEAAGEDFERKRAWDWTAEESERWDRRQEEKQRNRDDVLFRDYADEAAKMYNRQVKEFKPDLDAYRREKMEAVQKAAAAGRLEIVETENGELIAVDKDGSFMAGTGDVLGLWDKDRKPSKEAVDNLVADIKRADERRMARRRQRMKDQQQDDGDVTYINEKVCGIWFFLGLWLTI